MPTKLLAIFGDPHCGGNTGLHPKEPTQLDDGGSYSPSVAQLWLNDCWEDYWNKVNNIAIAHGADIVAVANGDMIDGDHHSTHQIITKTIRTQIDIAKRCLTYPILLGANITDWIFTRGTAVHNGSSGGADEALGCMFGARKFGDNSSTYEAHLTINGVNIRVGHHGVVGKNFWTKGSSVNRTAAQQCWEYLGQEWVPKYDVRNHAHRFADSGKNYPITVLQNGCWQFPTEYGHKGFPGEWPSIGGLYIIIKEDGSHGYDFIEYLPKKSEPITI